DRDLREQPAVILAARRELAGGAKRHRAEPLAGGAVRIGDDGRTAAVRLLADAPLERQRAEEGHPVLGRQALAAELAEDRLLVAAARADVKAHVLDDAEHRHADLLV